MRSAPPAPAPASRLAALDWLWLAFWIAASSLWCVTAAQRLSATFDEPLYIARGLDHWRTGSRQGLLRLGTMPLPVDLQTLPIYIYETRRGAGVDPTADLDRLLPWARAATLGFWWLLLVYGWLAGRALAGTWGGRLSVALLACEPSLLAHAGLATTDLALAACILALVYHVRVGREAGSMRRVGLPMVWFAAALLSKASAIVIGPLCLVVVGLEERWSTPQARVARLTGTGAGRHWGAGRSCGRDIAVIVAGGVLLAFVYCGSDWQREPSFVAWAQGLPDESAARAPMVWLADHLRIFTNAGDALVRQMRHNIRGHATYLLGNVRPRAVWYYFPVLLTIKLSEPLLLGALLVAAACRRALRNWALLLAATLVVCSVTFRVQLGIRMVLPIVVFAAIGVAAALVDTMRHTAPGWTARVVGLLAGIAIACNAGNALAMWPDALTYVNRLWGGTADGYRLVSDSNYDWGQGVQELIRWHQRHDASPLAVWYFGGDPLARRASLRDVPLHTLPITTADEVVAALHGHLVAVSTTLLYGPGLDGEAYRQSVAVLRARRPIDRTTTFLIYDFTAG
jgi:hypothetical protein